MKINEIFYSVQGEGHHTGKPAVFIRFSGCNLKCHFCDTDHQDNVVMTEDEVIDEVSKFDCRFVVLTGGEPSLQVTEGFVDKLHSKGFYVAIETNGTREIPSNIDWVTISPKEHFVGEAGKVILKNASELKVVFDGLNENTVEDKTFGVTAVLHYIQPCDSKSSRMNRLINNACVEFVKKNEGWRISVQAQKMLDVR